VAVTFSTPSSSPESATSPLPRPVSCPRHPERPQRRRTRKYPHNGIVMSTTNGTQYQHKWTGVIDSPIPTSTPPHPRDGDARLRYRSQFQASTQFIRQIQPPIAKHVARKPQKALPIRLPSPSVVEGIKVPGSIVRSSSHVSQQAHEEHAMSHTSPTNTKPHPASAPLSGCDAGSARPHRSINPISAATPERNAQPSAAPTATPINVPKTVAVHDEPS